MEDWAEKAAAQAAEQDRIRAANLEKSNREARVRAEIGPTLFRQLHDWLLAEVEKYNKLRGSNELVVETVAAQKPIPGLVFDHISVKRADGKKTPLKISYSPLTGILHYDCGAGPGSFTLTLDGDGQANFKTPYHVIKTIEEIGTEMLSKFQESQF